MSVEELKEKALCLKPEERAYLAQALIASLDEMNEEEIEKLWIQEAVRRDQEIERGEARLLPADEVFERIRARRR